MRQWHLSTKKIEKKKYKDIAHSLALIERNMPEAYFETSYIGLNAIKWICYVGIPFHSNCMKVLCFVVRACYI